MTFAENPRLGMQQFYVEFAKPRPKDRDPLVRYPRTDFRYNPISAQINVLDGNGVLVVQTSGKDEDNKVNPDVVAHFQSVIVGEASKNSLEVPAGSWYLFYNTGNKPLVGEIISNSESPVDQLGGVPFLAFEIVGQNGALALLPTLRVRGIKSVDRGGISYAKQDRSDRNIMPG